MERPQDVQHTVYVFDGFHLDVTRRKLISSGGLVRPLNSRAMDALLLLVVNAGQMVEKRSLMEAVWPSAIVEDNNLNQCILAIRKALGEVAGSNRYVMTVPGRGYRFVCPVRVVTQESPPEQDVGDKSSQRMPAALWLGIVLVLWMTAILLMSAGRSGACAVYSTGTSTDELLPSQHFTRSSMVMPQLCVVPRAMCTKAEDSSPGTFWTMPPSLTSGSASSS
jgi:DNA-binding winged helix-turn-helix (wHTH) protein